MIITCPHCQTKYQVTYEAIGSVGRKVQCAHCHKAWTQEASHTPAPRTGLDAARMQADKVFDAMAEDALDEVMAAEESAVAAQNGALRGAAPRPPPEATQALPGIDPAELKKRQMAFARRQNAMFSSLPLARLRRAARVAGAVILVGLAGGAWFGRVPIVERYPDLAGLYEAVGLGVNVVGLDFTNLETLKTLSGGNDVLSVSAQIVGRSKVPVPVPPVVIANPPAAPPLPIPTPPEAPPMPAPTPPDTEPHPIPVPPAKQPTPEAKPTPPTPSQGALPPIPLTPTGGVSTGWQPR